jgi:hypothetical protein
MRILATLLLLAGVAAPSVDYDRDVDFSRYHTWAWASGVTRAMDATTDNRIREAIENGLAAHGLSRADKDATLLVVYHASKTSQIDLVPVGKSDPSNKTGIQYAEKGSLVIEMQDAASGKAVWRGHATGVLRYGPPEIAAQIKAAVDGLLVNFPPPGPSPSR